MIHLISIAKMHVRIALRYKQTDHAYRAKIPAGDHDRIARIEVKTEI